MATATNHAPLPLGGKGEAGLDVFLRQVRKVIEDFGDGHSSREVGEDVVNGDAHAADARTAAATCAGSIVIRDRQSSS